MSTTGPCASTSRPRAGAHPPAPSERVLRLQLTPPELRANGRLCATLDGFSLHAAATVARHELEDDDDTRRIVLDPEFQHG